MKKVITCFYISIFIPGASKSQCKENFLGSKTLYNTQQEQNRQAPAGYLPVFINHVGRHGARHLTKDVTSSYIYKLLLKADSLHALTTSGQLLKQRISNLEKIEQNNIKFISLQGALEQKGIADRMFEHFNTVFQRPDNAIHFAYTKEIRTLQTSDAFLNELKTKLKAPAISKQLNDTILRFYDLAPAYTTYEQTGSWHQYLVKLKKDLQLDKEDSIISKQFFLGDFFARLQAQDRSKFISDLFGYITILPSLQLETEKAGFSPADVDLQSFLSCEQLLKLKEFDNAEDFYQKGPADNIDGIQVKIALPLLADFINTTNDFIRSNSINLQLRFAHAETISPFASLLGLSPAISSTKNSMKIINRWDAAEIIPLSSNIQWIIYKNQSNQYLVKVLLNEKEVAIKNLKTKSFPYYKWQDLRNYYVRKIKNLNASLEYNYLEYLQKVK